MNARIAARMAALEPFHAMDVMTRAHELERQGRSIIHMEVGESDFATPQPVLDAAARALQKGNLPHTLALGLPDLREAIAHYYENRYRIGISPERIVVTSGSSGGLLLAFGVLIDPGVYDWTQSRSAQTTRSAGETEGIHLARKMQHSLDC